MCGICGVIARTPIGPEDEQRALRINRALRHRGPDGEGTHRSEHLQFCMRRLSIIDRQGILSRAGAEAMSVMKAPPGGYHWLPFAVLVLEVWCREMEAMLTS